MSRKAITEEEVAKHSTADDCWVIMHDLVLKLPKEFLDEHPGGGDVISVLAGKNCGSDFEDIAHSDSAREWANKYIIGYVDGAPEEAQTKMMPTQKEHRGAGGGGSGMGAVVPLLAVILLAVMYFVLNKSS
eukprot:TRINITY_DN9204_c0_g2_i1.p1 TRINITY_DN9204_c0_g2~~TRINITY_DN9204_c0_g2_i1.p1  ORF type:complete len:131 (-),score=43.52 TRINITY_DN9204_c0_g2_i1:290-682(-)